MYNPSGYESELATLIGESPEDYEYDERARSRNRPGVRTPPRGGVMPPRQDAGFATRTELTTAVTRLDQKIGTTSSAIQTLDGRVGAIGADVTKVKATAEQLKRSIDEVKQLSMLLPLLASETTRSVSAAVTGTALQANDRIVVDSGDSFSRILPLLLLSGGIGGLSPGGGSGSSGGMDSLLPIVLLLTMKK